MNRGKEFAYRSGEAQAKTVPETAPTRTPGSNHSPVPSSSSLKKISLKKGKDLVPE